MAITLNLKEKFELSDGVTVLACEVGDTECNVIGKQLRLTSGEELKQVLTITGERKVLNKKTNVDQRVFETNDVVLLSSDEVRNGEWMLVGE